MRWPLWLGVMMLPGLLCGRLGPAAEPTWRVGTARIKITPQEPLWMAGFASRDRPAEGKLQDLWIKILVLQAADGQPALIVTSDVCGISKATYETLCRELERRCGLARSEIKLTYSHTHSGPAMRECLQDYYSWDDAAWDRVTQYTLKLEKAVVDAVAEAMASMKPATLWATEGTADFGVNRRNNRESQIHELLASGEPLKGPVDHRVPLLAVRGSDGRIEALVFGYACHTSMLAGYQWSGDYAGFAQLALEEKHPGVQAMFYQACGGDQGAMPRRTVELTRRNGLKLAAAVEKALAKPMRPVAPQLKTAFEFVDLPFEKTMSAADLEDFPNKGAHYQRWAKRMLKRLEAGETFPRSFPYAVQVWKLGDDQLWISMGGEPVVDYSLKFAKMFGPTTWTNGFSHDLTSYIPSRRVWEEGGYEGGYLGEYGLPAMRWAADVEDRITAAVERLVDRVRTYDVVVERDVMVPMRDGVKLATDVYLPAVGGKPVERKFPALLMRTAYNKERWGPDIVRFFARHGYVSVTQDCRGRYKSEGRFFPWVDDPEDGYDTIEWIAAHPHCNGRVGMHGPSHMAWVQFHAATQTPPHLKAMAPFQGPINAYKYSMRCGGALHLGLLKWVVQQAATSQGAERDPAATNAVRQMAAEQSFLDWAARIPWQRGKTPLAAFPQYEEAAFQLYFENNDYNAFWRQPGLGMDEYFDRFPDMPILWITSWFDWYPRTISDGYQAMVARGREDQYLIIGPWTHWNFRYTVGDVNFPNQGGGIGSREEFLRFELAWFDRHLKGAGDVESGPPVQVYVMGGGDGRRASNGRLNHGGRWHHGDAWPPKDVEPTRYYLRAGGTLSLDKPSEPNSSSAYTYDPQNTVSSNGRCIISYGPSAGRGFAGMGPQDQIELATLPGHGTPGRRIVDRPDVLVFQTPPLDRDVAIAGDVRVALWVSSDAPDTDFYVKLVDVHPPGDDYPQGYGFPVSEGILRARYREGFGKPVLMEPGARYRLEFPLEPAANRFLAGHRIQIYVASSNFPNFDINRNTGDPTSRESRPARNTIYHDAGHPSHIELPVWPAACEGGESAD